MSPELNMDEIDIPNEMAYTIFAPYIQRELVKGGMRPRDAIRAIKNRDEATAGKALDVVMKERPLWFSRHPAGTLLTLWEPTQEDMRGIIY